MVAKTVSKLKKIIKFKPQIRSRHPSHSWFKKNIGLLPFRSIVRLGSTSSIEQVFRKRTSEQKNKVVECNTIQSIKNSANKKLMKACFKQAKVKTAEYWLFGEQNNNELPYPIIVKHIFGSRGEGISLINSKEELAKWIPGKTLSNYIIEKYYNYSREYRLHVTEDKCFYTCRKML